MRAAVTLLAAALALCGPACTSLHQAGKEFSEAYHVGVGFSPRPAAMIWFDLPVFGASLGYIGDSAWVGNDYGYTHGWYQVGHGLLLEGRMLRSEFGHRIGGLSSGLERRAYLDQEQYALVNLIKADHRDESRPGSIGVTRIDFGVHLLFVGFSLGIDVLQFLDACSGLCGVDLLWDDDEAHVRALFD
ncbi:MAG: hypothetical protein H6825_10085 [Planctomycetes bacterium]|nr:hypothetical protein [Planctomycetota bacterium]